LKDHLGREVTFAAASSNGSYAQKAGFARSSERPNPDLRPDRLRCTAAARNRSFTSCKGRLSRLVECGGATSLSAAASGAKTNPELAKAGNHALLGSG